MCLCASAKSSRDVCCIYYTYYICIDRSTCVVCMDVLRSLLVSLEIICSRCTVYDSYRARLVCVWDGVFVKRRDSHERHWNSVRIVYKVCIDPLCQWVISVPALFRRNAVSQVLGPGVVFCTLLYAAHGPGYTRLNMRR